MGFFSSASKLEKLEKRLADLEKENELLKNTMSEINQNLIVVDTAMNSTMMKHLLKFMIFLCYV